MADESTLPQKEPRDNCGESTPGYDIVHSGSIERGYSLTKSGELHLQEWPEVMAQLASTMKAFTARVEKSRVDA
jgi:hypothetical protein